MIKRDLVAAIEEARKEVSKEISGIASQGGRYSGALSSEGYMGGYRDALDDVMLLLNNVTPHRYPMWKTRK